MIMSQIQYIMYKDIPVAKINGFDVNIINFDRLPFELHTRELDFDMIFHGWTEIRIMNIGRTNAKALTASLHLSQKNTYAIGKLLHFTQFTDCYWIKSENENITWKDVNPYVNSIEERLSRISLTGESADLRDLTFMSHLQSPELAAQGVSAKCLVKEPDGLYLYKVARKEIAASQILDELDISHIQYTAVPEKKLEDIATKARIEKIKNNNEAVCQCKIISNEETSLLAWDDFLAYCSHIEVDPYAKMQGMSNYHEYHLMNIADYILGNNDRHGVNWGFAIDNDKNIITGLHPLMDHDHSFDDSNILCQTTDKATPLFDAAISSIQAINAGTDFLQNIRTKPDYIDDKEWEGVLSRRDLLQKALHKDNRQTT